MSVVPSSCDCLSKLTDSLVDATRADDDMDLLRTMPRSSSVVVAGGRGGARDDFASWTTWVFCVSRNPKTLCGDSDYDFGMDSKTIAACLGYYYSIIVVAAFDVCV